MSGKAARRHALAEAQNWRCAHCGAAMRMDSGHEESATVEHVVPLGQGGRRLWGNEVSAHARCNFARGTKKLDEVSMSIARELMDKERAAEAAIAARRAEEMLAEVDDQLRDIQKLLIRATPVPATVAVLQTVNAMIEAGRSAPIPSRPTPSPSWIRTLWPRLRRLAGRFRARGRIVVQALVNAWRAPIPAPAADVPQPSGTALHADQKADWTLLYAPTWTAHMSRRPRGESRDHWRMQFFKAVPTALSHPGCPAEYRTKAPPAAGAG